MNKTADTTNYDTAYAVAVLLAAIIAYRYQSVALGIIMAICAVVAIYGHSKGAWSQMAAIVQPHLSRLTTAVSGLFVRQSDEVSEADEPFEFSPGQEIETRQFVVTDLFEAGSFGVYAMTRTGKSSFMKSVLYQLIIRNSPAELQLVISDLKDGLDFAKFRYLKHLALPVAETTAQSEQQIIWLLKEKQRRSELFKAAPRFDVPSNLNEYHELNTPLGLPRLPIILAIFDEFQNVTLENEAALNGLVKIAKEGQAFGIYVVCSTQLPMVEALPTKLKSQLTSWFCGYLANPSDYYKIVQIPKDVWEPFHSNGKIRGRFIANLAGEMMVIQSIFIQAAELKRALKMYSNENEPEWPEIEAPKPETYDWYGSEDRKRAMFLSWLASLDHEPTADEAVATFGFSQATFYNWMEKVSTHVEK